MNNTSPRNFFISSALVGFQDFSLELLLNRREAIVCSALRLVSVAMSSRISSVRNNLGQENGVIPFGCIRSCSSGGSVKVCREVPFAGNI